MKVKKNLLTGMKNYFFKEIEVRFNDKLIEIMSTRPKVINFCDIFPILNAEAILADL